VHECSKHLLPTFGFRWCYAELKDRLAAGTPLSREELDFIGAYEKRRSGRGWHQPDQLAALQPLYELDAEPSAEDAAILQKLMSVGTEAALEFLG
jgi:hypothetical protein